MGEAADDPCVILHVDMDAFYVSVMTRRRPELQGRPVVVGGGDRGVVLSASYEARALGITSGMSGVRARRLCPDLVALPPDFGVLMPISRGIMTTLRSVTPVVEVASLDEAYLDVRGARRLLGDSERIADLVRSRVADEHGLPCSVGIAATCSVAKLASRLAKPDGVFRLPPEDLVTRMHPLPVGSLHGVGPATVRRLSRLGVVTVGDLAALPDDVVRHAVGRASSAHLRALASGTDRDRLRPGGAGAFGLGEGVAERSAGAQRTLPRDVALDERSLLHRELLALAVPLARRVRASQRWAAVVGVDVRTSAFVDHRRERRLTSPTAATPQVHRAAATLLDRLLDDLAAQGVPALRRVGVRLAHLRPVDGDGRQLELGEPEIGWPEVERTLDDVQRRFGRAAPAPATLLGRRAGGARPPERPPGWPEEARPIGPDR